MALTLPVETSPLITLPSDVLGQVALESVPSTSNIPTLRDLSTIHSLLLTCRITHNRLSLLNNPNLYANIWKLMFDFDSMKRWMGATTITSSSLASEIRPRFEALKKFRSALRETDGSTEGPDIDSTILIRLFMMLTENDERNLYQFLEVVDISRLPTLLCSYTSSGRSLAQQLARSPHMALVVALMWLSLQGTLINENVHIRTAVLDLLQPLTFGIRVGSERWQSLRENLDYPEKVINIKYFGLRCKFKIPYVVPFVRLCTVDRYNVLARQVAGRTCNPSTNLSSSRFDHDIGRYLRLDTKLVTPQFDVSSPRFTASHGHFDSFVGHWEGSWFIGARIEPTLAIDMSVRFVDEVDGNARAALERVWLPSGVIFNENPTSLEIYDPEKAEWLIYIPPTDVTRVTDETETVPAVADTILVGNTDPAHGQKHGDFTFHGRVRGKDGHIALIRKPLDPHMDHQETWVFHGDVYGSLDFVGDWWVTSETKHPGAGHGWFHLSKIDGEPRA